MDSLTDLRLFAVVPSPELRAVAWTSLACAAASSIVIVADLAAGHRQSMAIMNVVWPLTALYAGPLALLAYFGFGRSAARAAKQDGAVDHAHALEHRKPSMPRAALLGATHCGAGCMLGDVVAEGGLFLLGATAILGSALMTSYVFDFVAAYLLGVVFQYFAIVPMRHLSPGRGIWAAVKADTLSLLAFQVGMYAWMAIYQLAIFHPRLEANSPVYWLMMQVGMLAGLATSYPMNWWLVKAKIKEAM